MSLNVKFQKLHNYLLDEAIVIPRLVNQQTLEFNQFCEYLADGSTVTATDVAAVMKRIETKLPFILGLNTKVVCSPEGLTFRPAVSGSVTQSQLKARLEARLVEDPAAEIDPNRELKTSDLTVSDLTASIAIELPKKWIDRFKSEADFKRTNESSGSSDNSAGEGDKSDNTGGGSTGSDPDLGSMDE